MAMDVAISDGDQGSRKVDRESQLGGVEGMIRGRLVFVWRRDDGVCICAAIKFKEECG